jgi:hypothetical protein
MKGEIGSEIAAGLASSLAKSVEHEEGLPESATQIQMLLALCSRWVRDAGTLEELIDWLDSGAADEIRSDFDRVLEWPLVQALGAFVQSAWASKWDQATDWSAWIRRLDKVYAYAKCRASPNLAAEAAKAKAIVLTEYLSRPNDAMEAIDVAEREFGRSAVLDEQRVNVLFQGGDDTKVVELWERFVADHEVAIDPFAYRRVAISAARLHMWLLAEKNFRKAAEVTKAMPNSWSRVGLLADCALVVSLEGGQRRAASTLVEALNSLPDSASEDNAHGEAVQRIMSEIGRRIEDALYKPSDAEPKIEPGRASSPSLEVPRIASGQSLRTALTTAQVVKLAACFGIPTPVPDVSLLESADTLSRVMVHWVLAEARLAMALAQDTSSTFITPFVEFVAATAMLGRTRASEIGESIPPTNNDLADYGQWLGHVVAAACCSGDMLVEHLHQWLSTVRALDNPPNGLELLILQIQAGAQIETRNELWSVVADFNASIGTRCGAAAKLMQKGLPPTELLQIQVWLTSAMMGGASGARQELFAFSVAKRFATFWGNVAANPFQLRTPRVTVPGIKANIAEVSEGRVTLRTFLLQMSRILNQPVGDFVPHVR